VQNADTAIGFSLHLYLLRISLIANQLSQPPVIYRTFLFWENHPPVYRYILGVTGVRNIGLFPVKPEVEGSSPFGPALLNPVFSSRDRGFLFPF